VVTLASATSKTKKKLVCLLSFMHDHPVISETAKLEIMMFNSTKGGVDTFDQMFLSVMQPHDGKVASYVFL